MKILFLLFVMGLLSARAMVETPSQARDLLSIRNHISDLKIASGIAKTDSPMFRDQIDAIKVLGKLGTIDDVAILIPYLDYPGPGSGNHISIRPPDLATEKELWPALGAILNIPGSEKSLSAYALASDNPLNLRLTALEALKYLSKSDFESCIDQLKATYSGNHQILGYLNFVQTRPMIFIGVVDIKTVDKIIALQSR